ncbi:unnamed protein product [Dracunculus medinensis]|uniref:Endo/exonuclease/phosphatase domain-containing protein n=1 Tax=Dracunculus medinensis TaxID=318479 RepID=A0A0N4UK52_DRAME|nr:unnamed protein product [Dracunculus medinensis]
MSGTGASAASGAGLWKKAVSALLVYFSLIPTDSAASQCFMQQYSLCTISLTKYVFSEFLAMKLMTHNFLTSKFLKGVVNGSKPAIMSKIRVAAGVPPVTLSPSDSMVKGSNTLDAASASPDAHDTRCSDQRYWLYHCGASNNSGRNGVAIVISDKADDRDKDKFYAELQLLTKSLPKHDMIIIGGDWNARVNHNAMALTIGKYCIADWCANGERLLRYAEEHELFITNT